MCILRIYWVTRQRSKGSRTKEGPLFAGRILIEPCNELSFSLFGVAVAHWAHRRPVWVIVIGDPEMNVTLRPRPGVLFLARANVSPTQFYFQQLLFLFYRVLQDILL